MFTPQINGRSQKILRDNKIEDLMSIDAKRRLDTIQENELKHQKKEFGSDFSTPKMND